jgi:hypothetical protein
MPASANGIVLLTTFWTTFKAVAITGKSLPVQYDSSDSAFYTIFAFDGNICYTCLIWTGSISQTALSAGYTQVQNDSDKTDFTTNYLPTANKNIAAAVKPASTAAVATDPALVVAISPNNPVTVVPSSTSTLSTGQNIIFTNATVTTSGSQVFTNYGVKEITLIVNIKAAPTGTNPRLQWNLQEVDPVDGTTVFDEIAETPALATSGVYKTYLIGTHGGSIKVSWTISGTTPSFTQVDAVLTSKVVQAPTGRSQWDFTPSPYVSALQPFIDEEVKLAVDGFGQLVVRGNTLTDEGSFRDDFPGGSLTSTIPGTTYFTSGSDIVTGVGSAFSDLLAAGSYVRRSADADANYTQILRVISDTQFQLSAPYPGTTGSSAGTDILNNWNIIKTGGGGSPNISVASSICTISSGTPNNSKARILKAGDYLPMKLAFRALVSQRIANQTNFLGFSDNDSNAPGHGCYILFDGTDATSGKFISQFADSGSQTLVTFTLPHAGVTSTFHNYEINLSATSATLEIDGILISTITNHIPDPYTAMDLYFEQNNTAIVTAGSIQLDWVFFNDSDQLEISNSFGTSPIGVTSPEGANPVAIAMSTDLGTKSWALGGDNRLRVGTETLIFYDPINGSTVNTVIWTQSQSGMTQTQANSALTLNAASSLVSGNYSILTSQNRFLFLTEYPMYSQYRAKVVFQTNTVVEFGFGNVATTAAPTDGVFFRVDGAGNIRGVVNFNGTETTTAILATLSSTIIYNFEVFMFEDHAQFEITTNDGFTVDVVTYLAIPNTQVSLVSIEHLPTFARVYNSGTAPAAAQLVIGSVNIQQLDVATNKMWPAQMSTIGHHGNINPNTFAQTLQLAAGAAPTTTTPTNATCAYATLGGEYSLNMTAASENLLGVFGFQVPSPFTFFLTDIWMSQPVVTTAFTTTATVQEWCIMVASSNNPSTATGQRYPLSFFTAAASAAVGTMFNGTAINLTPTTPITIYPGQFLLVLVKNVVGAATGVYRGSIMLNGYYE